MDEKLHNIILEGRKKLNITGINEVISFNECEILVSVNDAVMSIRGEKLKIEEVSKMSGEVLIEGEIIESIVYVKGHKKSREGLIGRMFK